MSPCGAIPDGRTAGRATENVGTIIQKSALQFLKNHRCGIEKKQSQFGRKKSLRTSIDSKQHFALSLAKFIIPQFQYQLPQKPQSPVRSDVGIHINHLRFFIVCGGHIFIDDVAVLRKSIECQIEVLCIWEKIASAGVIQL